MKNTLRFKNIGSALCLCVLWVVVFCLSGCSSPGETPSEIHQKHVRTIKTNTLQIQDDIDRVFLIDKPSKLSEKIIR